MRDNTNTLKSAIYGLAVGDALGVPYEFKFRGAFECTDMREPGRMIPVWRLPLAPVSKHVAELMWTTSEIDSADG